MGRIQRALISVSDKTGVVEFAQVLADAGVELLSTGGTARALREAGLEVMDLSAFTGFPEMLDGRVKTLHPKVHGGLLYLRDNQAHVATAAEHGLAPIDMVVVNLYPFEATIAKEGCTMEDAIENIDIGGPSMLRSAAKNHASVTVITHPEDYEEAARQVRESGETTLAFRRQLATKVYRRTGDYDTAIANYLEGQGAEEGAAPSKTLPLASGKALRYGENPHQQAAVYGAFDAHFEQLQGKALSYNNILDMTAAGELIGEFDGAAPTLAILKHTNPCGVGAGDSLAQAWDLAYATDRQAPFGGIIAVNRSLDGDCARAIAEIFCEVILAPSFDDEALAVLGAKKNLRLVRRKKAASVAETRVRGVGFGCYLTQDADNQSINESDWKVVTERAPTDAERQAMGFGWRVVKHVKSNAIVYAGADRTLGVGAGQMSRVDSSRIAVWKAGEAGLSLENSVVCSDAFFPFPDGLIAAADAGATAAIQPGGSVRDEEVIAAANERGIAMIFTGRRHFRH